MKRYTIFAYIFLLVSFNSSRAEDYQKTAEATPWYWSEERASVVDSALQFSKDYEVDLIRKKNTYEVLTIRIVDDGKELYAWEGHRRTVFTLNGDILIYADFSPISDGCSLVAFDLKNQKRLWKTRLKARGSVPHSKYSNAVILDVIGNDIVRVFGSEGGARYVELVDLKTGKTVGHRRYEK